MSLLPCVLLLPQVPHCPVTPLKVEGIYRGYHHSSPVTRWCGCSQRLQSFHGTSDTSWDVFQATQLREMEGKQGQMCMPQGTVHLVVMFLLELGSTFLGYVHGDSLIQFDTEQLLSPRREVLNGNPYIFGKPISLSDVECLCHAKLWVTKSGVISGSEEVRSQEICLGNSQGSRRSGRV